MRSFAYLLFLFFVHFILQAQNTDTWTAFWNQDTTLIGFKDKEGKVKIEPRFMGFTMAKRFEDIIAVTEEGDQFMSYYLTKKGKKVGLDSLHIYDNGADCESEGFIRFRDKKSDKVGMFNRTGEVAIPAEYNELTRVRNGMVIALKGAEKKWEGDEHYRWIGGREILIDTTNRILIDSFYSENNLNLFSLQKFSHEVKDPIRQEFKGIDGQYYSFIDYEKEFSNWLRTYLFANFSKENLLNSTFPRVSHWKKSEGWVMEPKDNFLGRNFEGIRSILLKVGTGDVDYHIFEGGLNPFIYDPEEYAVYFNNCGEAKDWEYPVKSIVITRKHKKDYVQDHFDFLRTGKGYQLVSVSFGKGKIR